MRVNCTDYLRCVRLTNSFNSLRLHGQQEMEYKHRGVLKMSAVKHWTNTPVCFTDGIACVGVCVSLSLCACIYKCMHECVCVCVWSSPALQDTPATVRVLQFQTRLAVFLLEARLHRHLGDLEHYNMKYDQTVHLRGDTAQNMKHLKRDYKCFWVCCRCAEWETSLATCLMSAPHVQLLKQFPLSSC